MGALLVVGGSGGSGRPTLGRTKGMIMILTPLQWVLVGIAGVALWAGVWYWFRTRLRYVIGQSSLRVVFGKTTVKAAEKAGLRIDILAPTPKVPSMSKALDMYIEKANKK